MENSNLTNATIQEAITDMNALRLPTNYGATLGVKKILNTVPVGKTKSSIFFRTHPDAPMTFAAMTLEHGKSKDTYIVYPTVSMAVPELVRRVVLHAAIDRQNNIFLIPVQLPNEDGTRNPWHESLAQAVECAKTKWIRISANQNIQGYNIFAADADLPEPDWPDSTIETLIEVAFRGKIINSIDHPVIQSLLGRI